MKCSWKLSKNKELRSGFLTLLLVDSCFSLSCVLGLPIGTVFQVVSLRRQPAWKSTRWNSQVFQGPRRRQYGASISPSCSTAIICSFGTILGLFASALCVLSHFSSVQFFVTLWTVAHQASLCPWDSPGKTPGVGCHFLLQGILLTQGSNPCVFTTGATWETLCHQP